MHLSQFDKDAILDEAARSRLRRVRRDGRARQRRAARNTVRFD